MGDLLINNTPKKLIIFFLLLGFLILMTARLINFYHNQLSLSDILITFIATLNFGICIFAVKESLSTQYLSQETILQKENLRAMEDALKEIRSERHDFINHLHSIQGYLLIGEREEAINYLKEVGADCKFNSQILSIPIPNLRAFLLSKKNVTDKEEIDFKLKVQSKLELLKIRSVDITTIFGNLIDNAIEAVKKIDYKTKEILFSIYETEGFYHFEIQDSGPTINEEDFDKIFNPGYSSHGKNRGYGLALVKKTIEKYEGSITYDRNTKSFIISLPKSEEKV